MLQKLEKARSDVRATLSGTWYGDFTFTESSCQAALTTQQLNNKDGNLKLGKRLVKENWWSYV